MKENVHVATFFKMWINPGSHEWKQSALAFNVCLFVYCLSSRSRIFHSYGDVTITGERLQILTYTRRLRPLSSEGSLACHTCCDTGHPFLRSSPRTRDIHTCCRAFGSGTVTTCVNDLGLSRPGFEHPTFRMRGERSTD